MKKLNFNPIALLGFLSLIGFLGFITGEKLWFSWFAWSPWFARYNTPTDERFFKNIGKSALISFFVAVAGLASIVILKELNVSQNIIFSVIGGLLALLLVSFTFLFVILESRGE